MKSEKPAKTMFTRKEWQTIQKNKTPRQVQRFLQTLAYNREAHGETQRSFREVIKHQSAHCLEAAITAAVILEQHGYPPLLVSFESVDDLDHVIYVFKSRGLWGAIARSRDAGLHGRKPVFRTLRQLVMSYFDPYVDHTGRITGYALVNLNQLGNYNWRFSPRNLWKLEQYLIDFPHISIVSSEKRYQKLLKRYKEFRKHSPDEPILYYNNRKTWM